MKHMNVRMLKPSGWWVLVIAGVSVLLVAGCVTPPRDDASGERVDRLMDRWYRGLTNADLDLLMDTYADDAVLHGLGPEGPSEFEGIDAIRAAQEPGMNADWGAFDFARADGLTADGADRAYTLSIPGEVTLVNSFVYEGDGDALRIVEQWITVREGE